MGSQTAFVLALILIPFGALVSFGLFCEARRMGRLLREAAAHNAANVNRPPEYDENGVPIYRPYIGVH